MALSAAVIDAHIGYWEQRLHNQLAPHRGKWPSKLFHHAPIDNAVGILTSGMIRSRNDPLNPRPSDVAGQGVIDTNTIAHDFVRMYFRPRTPTQYNIEGIRRDNECGYGSNAHAPILVMLLLDARKVLARDGVRISSGNMQVSGAAHDDNEAFFAAIPFDKVFHEGVYNPEREPEIKFHRCAEAMVPSPLALHDTLVAICCRSVAERDTLLHLLGPARPTWAHRVMISDDLRVFQQRHAFVREVALSRDRLVWSLNPRFDGGTIDVTLSVLDAVGTVLLARHYPELPSVPPKGDRWGIIHEFPDGDYLVEIAIEGHLAYRNQMFIGDLVF